MSEVRVRIAPSPTGFFHIGNAKTALINWLFARKTGGTFILRIEDTDVERSAEEFAEVIFDALTWLGIDWDEGPAFRERAESGDCAPYRQSQRRDLHLREAHRLVEEGKAFKCFCSREEIEAAREQAQAEKRTPRYSGKCSHLTPEEIAAMGDRPYSIRFRVPEGATEINDLVQGTVRVENSQFDDFIIVKPNGDPVFHLAVVVDDGTMRISHVIRGDDHFTNAFRHVLLFQALGYTVPTFGHLPMVLDEQGRKYSKRLHGANVLDWRDDGFLPEALVNYLVLLGWTPGDDRELFTRDELLEAFSIERLGQSAGKFDVKRLQWLNGQHIRLLTPEELRKRIVPVLEKAGFVTSGKSPEWLNRLAAICQEKIPTLNDIVGQANFFFAEPREYDEKGVKKQWSGDDSAATMDRLVDTMRGVDPWTLDAIKAAFEHLAAEMESSLGKLVHPARLALTGKTVGPGLFELAELLGKEACVTRMEHAIAFVRSLREATA